VFLDDSSPVSRQAAKKQILKEIFRTKESNPKKTGRAVSALDIYAQKKKRKKDPRRLALLKAKY
jgi:hypothetical protein